MKISYLAILEDRFLKVTPFPSEAIRALLTQPVTEQNVTVGFSGELRKPVRFVICVAGLPPGGGKSTFYALLKSALEQTGKSMFCAVVSSDLKKPRKRFEKAVQDAIASGSRDQVRRMLTLCMLTRWWIGWHHWLR